jgi:hypothetical protein
VTCQPATATPKKRPDRLVVSRLGSHVNDPGIGGRREWVTAVGGAPSPTATDVGHAAPMFWRRSKRRKIFSHLTFPSAQQSAFHWSRSMTGVCFEYSNLIRFIFVI